MKRDKTNNVLMEALAQIQAAARTMSVVTDEMINKDGLLKASSADDELDFQELQNIASDVRESLCSLVPKMRLLIYIGAPKGTVYRKSAHKIRTSVQPNTPTLDFMELLERVDKLDERDRALAVILLQKQLVDYSKKQCPAPIPTAAAKQE